MVLLILFLGVSHANGPFVYKVKDVNGVEVPGVTRSFVAESKVWKRTYDNCVVGEGVYRHCNLGEEAGYFSFYVVVPAHRKSPRYVVCQCEGLPNQVFGKLLASMILKNKNHWPQKNEKTE